MEGQVSLKMLRQRAEAKIKELGKCGMSVSGSFVRTIRNCGKPACIRPTHTPRNIMAEPHGF